MNKAVILSAHGGPENFTYSDHDPGAPRDDEIQIRNDAIGVNFIDIYQRTGLYPVTLPAILGEEGAGFVDAVGKNVTDFRSGDRVAYLRRGGVYANTVNVPSGAAVKIPDTISTEIAAASFLKGLTVHMLVRDVYQLKAGETCLVYAAAGGVGTLLTQWATAIGATVIAVVGNEEKAVNAKANGAAHIIVRTQTDSIAKDVRKLTDGRGVDVVYDSIGAATFETSLDSLALAGRLISYGNASGAVPPVTLLDLASRGSLSITRPVLFQFTTPDRLPAMTQTLFSMIAAGQLRPNLSHHFDLEQAGDAQSLLESGTTQGSIILTP